MQVLERARRIRVGQRSCSSRLHCHQPFIGHAICQARSKRKGAASFGSVLPSPPFMRYGQAAPHSHRSCARSTTRCRHSGIDIHLQEAMYLQTPDHLSSAFVERHQVHSMLGALLLPIVLHTRRCRAPSPWSIKGIKNEKKSKKQCFSSDSSKQMPHQTCFVRNRQHYRPSQPTC